MKKIYPSLCMLGMLLAGDAAPLDADLGRLSSDPAIAPSPFDLSGKSRESLEKEKDEARQAWEEAERQYQNGVSDVLKLLSARCSFLEAELALSVMQDPGKPLAGDQTELVRKMEETYSLMVKTLLARYESGALPYENAVRLQLKALAFGYAARKAEGKQEEAIQALQDSCALAEQLVRFEEGKTAQGVSDFLAQMQTVRDLLIAQWRLAGERKDPSVLESAEEKKLGEAIEGNFAEAVRMLQARVKNGMDHGNELFRLQMEALAFSLKRRLQAGDEAGCLPLLHNAADAARAALEEAKGRVGSGAGGKDDAAAARNALETIESLLGKLGG